MALVPNNKMIEYLVSRKFGHISKAPLPMGSSFDSKKMHEELINKIDTYKNELSAMKYAELTNLYEQEQTRQLEALKLKSEQEENARFFNQAYANADFVHWSKAAHWTLDEAIALSFGKAPNIVNWGKVNPLTNISKFAIDYANRRDLALRAIPWKKLYDPVLPSIFLSWAKELQLEIPAALIAEVEKMGGSAINWYEEYQKQKKEYSEFQFSTKAAIAKCNEQLLVHEAAKENRPSNGNIDITKLHELQINALQHFFSPRKSVDAKKKEVVEWILEVGKIFSPPVSDNIAQAIFTIIKPTDHNPRKRRDVL